MPILDKWHPYPTGLNRSDKRFLILLHVDSSLEKVVYRRAPYVELLMPDLGNIHKPDLQTSDDH